MDAQVGSNGPGAIGKSNFTSGEFANAPSGTLSGGSGLGTSGMGGSGGNPWAGADTVATTSKTPSLNFNDINFPAGFMTDFRKVI